MLKIDGFDDCIAGVVSRIGMDDILCYDVHKVVDVLMTRDGMSKVEAEEYFSFNISGAWVGEGTPCFLDIEYGDFDERTAD